MKDYDQKSNGRNTFMKTIQNCLLAIFIVVALVVDIHAAPYNFNADNEGWLQSYIGRPTTTASTYDTLFPVTGADWEGTNGNPDGNIYQNANGIDQRAYWMGVNRKNLFGDLTGKSLQTDIFSTNNWQTIANGRFGDDGNVYARWVISNKVGDSYNMFISNSNVSIDINNLNGWETKSVLLTETNFTRWANQAANSQSFLEVLANYSSIGLFLFSGTDTISNTDGGTGTWEDNRLLHYGAYSNNGITATWRLDNLQAVPISVPVPVPAAIWLLGSGLLGLIGIMRRKNI